MRHLAAAAFSLSLAASGAAHAESPAGAAFDGVSPALKSYTAETLNNDLWQREGLSARDRSVVTVAALIAKTQAENLPTEFERALQNGVTPAELSEIITHLAFYSGWGNAAAAADVAREVFAANGVDPAQLPEARPSERLPLDEEAEQARHERVSATYGEVSQGVVDYTAELLFRDLWLRPALSPRDRSLVTVSALVAAGQTGAFGFHLGKALDNGVTKTEASEVLTQLAFYAGWPNVFGVMSTAKEVFNERAAQ